MSWGLPPTNVQTKTETTATGLAALAAEINTDES